MRILVLYASTSGSTRFVVQALVQELDQDEVECRDISKLEKPLALAERDLVVLVTPTYGTGDWHCAWEEKGTMLLSILPPKARVALLALGDSRGHKNSFAGGLAKLAALARSRGALLIGLVPSSDYSFESSPAVENGTFPGLVVEYRRNRHEATMRARIWMKSLIVLMGRSTRPQLVDGNQPLAI
jgi:flavodoxin I